MRQRLLSVGYACAAYSSRHLPLVKARVDLHLGRCTGLAAKGGGTLQIQPLVILPDEDWVLLCFLGLG